MEMADIHCHLMPYVDDGAYDRDECLELLKLEAAQGVRTICLTPHLRADMFESTEEVVLEHFGLVRDLVREAGLPLTLYHSREYHYDRLSRKLLQDGGLRPLGKGRTILLEFDGRHEAGEILEAVDRVRKSGWCPLIAHVERYLPLHERWGFAYDLREAGALLQLNAGSVLGREGFRQKHLCKTLLNKGLADIIASDAHDPQVRVPELDTCARYLEKHFARGTAQKLLCEGPLAILEG
ncbi:MAG: hypothetical protein IK095_00230 [Oscillospiraceae bacterium]|nr:hypothetical protein [Oscillospiraceae bacterium]